MLAKNGLLRRHRPQSDATEFSVCVEARASMGTNAESGIGASPAGGRSDTAESVRRDTGSESAAPTGVDPLSVEDMCESRRRGAERERAEGSAVLLLSNNTSW